MAQAQELPDSRTFLRQHSWLHEAESSTPLCRLTGCHLESMFSTDVIIQYLKGNSMTPMQDGTPSGLWKAYCLATSVYCSSQSFFFVASISPNKSVWIFFFFTHLKYKQTKEKDSKTQSCLVTECMAIPMGPWPKSRLHLAYTTTHYHIKRQTFL